MSDFFIDDFSAGEQAPITGPMVPDRMDCMRCGMCLSQCPTFQLTQDEQEGPRQRIRTLEKLVVQQATVSAEALTHLNNCTQCRACEQICPSQMDYALLFNQAQQKLHAQRAPDWLAKLGLALVAEPTWFRRVLPLVALYQRTPLKWLLSQSGLLKWLSLDALADFTRQPVLSRLSAQNTPDVDSKGRVALFTGCMGEGFDRETLDDTIKVLTAMGYAVDVPPAQVCCGAIHAHQGDVEMAKSLMESNRDCFNALEVDAIVYCATGCGVTLHEYAQWLGLDDTEVFVVPLFEVMAFVEQHWDACIKVKPAFERVAVHEPCSQRQVLKTQQSTYEVLKKVPGLIVNAMEDNHLCCGAGGVQMLTHPQQAQALRKKKLQTLQGEQVDYLVSSNIGCAIHLESGVVNGQTITVKHPVSVLAKQLEITTL